MFDKNLVALNLSQVQRFLMAAELLSFTSAAEELSLTQPVISKSIAAMERILGLTLFNRESGTVSLTPAGRHLFQFWSAMLPTIEQNVRKAHILQQGNSGQLAVGIHNFYDLSYFFMPIVNRFRRHHPSIALEPLCFSFPELRRRVMSGQLDAVFTAAFEGDDIRALGIEELLVQDLIGFPLQVNMLETNPLTHKDTLTVEDLRHQRFSIHSPSKVPSYKPLIEAMCMQRGFVPREYQYVEDATSFALSLTTDCDVYVVDRAAKIEPGIPLRSFDLEGTRSGICMVTRRKGDHSSLSLFVEECTAFFLEHPDPYGMHP